MSLTPVSHRKFLVELEQRMFCRRLYRGVSRAFSVGGGGGGVVAMLGHCLQTGWPPVNKKKKLNSTVYYVNPIDFISFFT